MLDVCCGLKGASEAMLRLGWEVITIDSDPAFAPDICVDIRNWHYQGKRPDLVWCSPPCTEFSRMAMPWLHPDKAPDLSVYLACKRIIREAKPVYWIIENVKGSVPYFGQYSCVQGPYFLWGFFPYLGTVRLNRKKKESYSSSEKALRAKIPFELSLAVAEAIMFQAELLPGESSAWL